MFNYLKNWLDKIFADEETLGLLLFIATVVLIIIFLGKMLAPFFAALIFAFLLQPLVGLLIRFHIPRSFAVVTVFILYVSTMFILLLLFIPILWQQLNNLLQNLPILLSNIRSVLNDLPEQYPGFITNNQVEQWSLYLNDGVEQASAWVLQNSLRLIPDLIGLIIYLVLVPILIFFLLKDQSILVAFYKSFLPTRRARLIRIGQEMNVQALNYVRGKALEIAIVGVTTYIVFQFMGLNYATLLAVLVGLSVLFPFVGATLVTIPVAMVAILQWGWSEQAGWVLGAYAVIQALDGNVLVPVLFSNTVNIHPISIILAILVFGGIWGFWGLFFAIPMATLVKAVFNAWKTPNSELTKY